MQDVIEQPARGRRARARIGKGKKIVAHEPDKMRRHDHERDDERDPGAGGGERGARIAVEQQEQSERRRQHTTKYFAHSERPRAAPSSSQWIMRPRRKAAWKA